MKGQIVLLASAMLAACGSSSVPDHAGLPPAGADRPVPCQPELIAPFSADWQPLPAAAELAPSAEVQAARERLLGPDATNPDTVGLWWYGVSSFVASMGGHLFLLDAWEIVGVHANYSPMTREDLAALRPEAIFVGHGHFDHAADMGYVAGRTGAVVIGGEATCALAREQAARDGNQDKVSCLVLGNTDAPRPGTVQRYRVWADMEEVTVVRHIHSAADPTDLVAGGTPLVFVPQLTAYFTEVNTDPQELLWFAESIDDEGGFGQPTGGAWAYHFKLRDFTLLWHDSAGPISEGNDYADEVSCALQTLPGCVDVHSGAIVSFGNLTSGLRDARLYVEHSHPRVSIPNHHDAWFPVLGPGAESYETQWREEVSKLAAPPELDYLNDPEDYLVARSYRVDDPIWSVPMPGSTCAR